MLCAMGVMVVVGYTAVAQGDRTNIYLRIWSATQGPEGDKGSWYLHTAELL